MIHYFIAIFRYLLLMIFANLENLKEIWGTYELFSGVRRANVVVLFLKTFESISDISFNAMSMVSICNLNSLFGMISSSLIDQKYLMLSHFLLTNEV